jgi:hypothetical protein
MGKQYFKAGKFQAWPFAVKFSGRFQKTSTCPLRNRRAGVGSIGLTWCEKQSSVSVKLTQACQPTLLLGFAPVFVV